MVLRFNQTLSLMSLCSFTILSIFAEMSPEFFVFFYYYFFNFTFFLPPVKLYKSQ